MAKKKEDKASKGDKNLKGFEIKINEFGEITSELKVDKINAFLNENVEDKKLKDKQKEE